MAGLSFSQESNNTQLPQLFITRTHEVKSDARDGYARGLFRILKGMDSEDAIFIDLEEGFGRRQDGGSCHVLAKFGKDAGALDGILMECRWDSPTTAESIVQDYAKTGIKAIHFRRIQNEQSNEKRAF